VKLKENLKIWGKYKIGLEAKPPNSMLRFQRKTRLRIEIGRRNRTCKLNLNGKKAKKRERKIAISFAGKREVRETLNLSESN